MPNTIEYIIPMRELEKNNSPEVLIQYLKDEYTKYQMTEKDWRK